jgi:hypothetical protein
MFATSHKSMLDYLFVNNHIEAFTALKQSAGIDYTPDPNARYTGLLEKKWTSVIRLQKKASAVTKTTIYFCIDTLNR